MNIFFVHHILCNISLSISIDVVLDVVVDIMTFCGSGNTVILPSISCIPSVQIMFIHDLCIYLQYMKIYY